MSTTDRLRAIKAGESHIFTDYKHPSQLSSYMARVKRELGYRFSSRAVTGGVMVTRVPNVVPAVSSNNPPHIVEQAMGVDVSEFF